MEQLILLLQERNNHLERFYEINSGKIGGLARGEFEELEIFYNEREHILSMVRHIDKVIEREQKQAMKDRVTSNDRAIIQSLLDAKEDIVKQILAQDLQILSIIETEKSALLKDLTQTVRSRKAMGSYKMSGESTPTEDER